MYTFIRIYIILIILLHLSLIDLVRCINDPEHPLTLEELCVVKEEHIYVNDSKGTVAIIFTPTIPHCSMATLIGLAIHVKLFRSLPERFKVIFTAAIKLLNANCISQKGMYASY